MSAAVRDKLKVAAVNGHQLFFKSRTVAETGIVIKEAVLCGDEANIIESQIAAKRLGGAKQLAHAAEGAKIRMSAGGIEIRRFKCLARYSHLAVKQIEHRANSAVLSPDKRALRHKTSAHKRGDILLVVAEAGAPQGNKFAYILFCRS